MSSIDEFLTSPAPRHFHRHRPQERQFHLAIGLAVGLMMGSVIGATASRWAASRATRPAQPVVMACWAATPPASLMQVSVQPQFICTGEIR